MIYKQCSHLCGRIGPEGQALKDNSARGEMGLLYDLLQAEGDGMLLRLWPYTHVAMCLTCAQFLDCSCNLEPWPSRARMQAHIFDTSSPSRWLFFFIFHTRFFKKYINYSKKRQQKQAHQHNTIKLKLHWQLQANEQARTPSFEHIRQTFFLIFCPSVRMCHTFWGSFAAVFACTHMCSGSDARWPGEEGIAAGLPHFDCSTKFEYVKEHPIGRGWVCARDVHV